jgi:hypothetical protein
MDLICSYVVLTLAACILATHALRAANASAILRLRAVACVISPGPAVARARKKGPRESTLPDVIARADAAG